MWQAHSFYRKEDRIEAPIFFVLLTGIYIRSFLGLSKFHNLL